MNTIGHYTVVPVLIVKIFVPKITVFFSNFIRTSRPKKRQSLVKIPCGNINYPGPTVSTHLKDKLITFSVKHHNVN